jgi:hypothetical protein
LKLSIIGNFVNIKDNYVRITPLGKKIISKSNEDEPNPRIIRELLLQIILNISPPWISFTSAPFDETIAAVPPLVIEILKKGELLDSPLSDEANRWWAAIRNRNIEIDKEFRKKIGDIAEELTIRYENARLMKEHHSYLAENIDHVSKKSDSYGFDISSFFGFLHPSDHTPDEILMIEVKSSTSDSNDNFRFYLTRTEWEKAKKNSNNYYFYLWKGICIEERKASNEKPMIFPSKIVNKYLPIDIHKNGKWTECRITLNLKEVKPYIINIKKID